MDEKETRGGESEYGRSMRTESLRNYHCDKPLRILQNPSLRKKDTKAEGVPSPTPTKSLLSYKSFQMQSESFNATENEFQAQSGIA